MKGKVTIVSVLFLLSAVPMAAAQPSGLANAGTTPGSLMYGLDQAGESISLALTFSKSAKAKKKLKYAEERLSEAKKLAEQGKTQKAQKIMDKYQKQLNSAQKTAQVIQNSARKRDVMSTVAQSTQKQQDVLQRVYEQVPAPAKDAIQRAMKNAATGHEQAVSALNQTGRIPSGVKPAIPQGPASVQKQKAQKFMEQGRQQLQRANNLMDQNKTQEAQQAYQEAQQSFQKAREASQGFETQDFRQMRNNAGASASGAGKLSQSIQSFQQGNIQQSRNLAKQANQDFSSTSGTTTRGGGAR